ncbi:hypothetical protein F5876DRAFT_69847 [Lentinula aff. lateritia]|uniref:Uncharacterized protein n=1 Tax=Lentinula aff. lateritia TaxID=2804960 RepID=A0ACC1TLD0_9AGAR|nr:hypothetical protein F5876DRAFT_69847 [Lentinula aff. lateritia]
MCTAAPIGADQDFHELPSFEGLNNLNADDLAFNALIQSSGFSEALMNLDFDHTLPGLDGPSALRVGASSNLAASGEVANSFVPSSAQLTNSLFLPNEVRKFISFLAKLTQWLPPFVVKADQCFVSFIIHHTSYPTSYINELVLYPASCPTTHAERNPLLPTQSIHARATRHLDAVQSRTMHEAKVEKQKLDLLLKQDVIKLMTTFEEMTASLAHKHHRTPAYVKELISTTSHLSRQKATGRMQALIHIESKEVNSTLPVGSKLKAPALRKLVDEDAELLALSDEQTEVLVKTEGYLSEKPSTWAELQSQCSAMVTSAFCYVLNSKTVAMNYNNYHTNIVAKYHVQLIGLPPALPEPVKPFDISDRSVLQDLHAALEAGTSEEIRNHAKWIETQIAQGKEVGKERVERSDKGTKRGPRKRTNNDDDDDDNNETNKPVQKHRRRKAPSQKASGISAGSRTKTTAPNAKRMRISKQLPPLPRSREFIDDDDEDQDQLIQNAEGEQSLARNRGGEGEDVEEDEDVYELLITATNII